MAWRKSNILILYSCNCFRYTLDNKTCWWLRNFHTSLHMLTGMYLWHRNKVSTKVVHQQEWDFHVHYMQMYLSQKPSFVNTYLFWKCYSSYLSQSTLSSILSFILFGSTFYTATNLFSHLSTMLVSLNRTECGSRHL